MKKISKFFKCTMLSILSLCMAFGVIFNVKDGNALRVNADTTSKVYSTDYYTISYADNELKILLSTSLSEYQDFSKDELNDLKNAIVSVGYSAILDDINFDLDDATASGLKNSRRHYASEQASEGYTYDISLITNVIKSQLSGSSNTEAALDDALGLDPITGEIAGAGTYDNLLEFYVNRYVETKTSEVEESSKEQEKEVAYAEISEQLTKAIQEVVDSTENYVIEDGTVASKVESIINNAKEEVVLEDLGAVTEVVNLIQNEKTEEGKSVIVEVIEQTQISNEVKDIIVEAKSDDVVNFIENLEASTIIDVVGSVKLDKEEIKTVINNVGVENLLPAINNKDFDKEQIEDLKEVVKDSGLTKDDIQEIVNENVSNISIVTLLTAIKTIKIDGHELYNGKELVLGGLEAVIRSFPKPAQIANYTDDQMNLTWNLEVGTTFGSVEFDFTVGFKGDCSRIRQAASYAADYVNFDIADGVVNVEVLAPGKLSDVMLRLSNTGRVSDDLKLDIFNNAFATVEEVYGKVTDRTYEDYLNVLKKVDYQVIVDNVYNAENLNRIFNTDKFTDARLDNFVDDVNTLISKASNITYDRVKSFVGKYYDISRLDDTAVETLINKAHDCLVKIDSLTFDSALLREFIDPNSEYSNDNIDEYIDKLERFEPQFNTAMDLLERAYNAAPDRFKDNSVMDFYKGDGTFNYAGAFNLDIEKWLNKASSKYGDEVYDALNVVFDKLPQQIDVNFTLNLTDIHSVTYNIGSEVKVGMLPAGANVELYANTTEIEGYEVFGWQDINGVQYTEMPNHDVELFPVIHSFEVAINEGVDKVYDAQAHELVVTTTPVGNGFAYQWYKDGALIEGATEATYSVVNVADSGEYYCTVSYFGKEKETDTVSVNISQAEIDVAGWPWDYENPFTYAEGTTHEVHVEVPDEYADLVKVTELGNTAEDASSDYKATATVESLNDNYVVVGTIAPLPWEILPQEVSVAEWPWDYTGAFVYDYEEHSVSVEVPTEYKEFAILDLENSSNLTATDVNTYNAVAVFESGNTNYVFVDQAELTWEIIVPTFSANVEADVSKTYDKSSETLTVTVEADNGVSYDSDYTYQWYKDGVAVENETEATLDVVNVADSGEYYVVVTLLNTPVESNSVVVEIKTRYLELSDIKLDATEFDYDENSHKVEVIGLDAFNGYATIDVTGTLEATDHGTYNVNVTVDVDDVANVALTNNGEATNENVVNFEWTIKAPVFAVEVVQGSFEKTYDLASKTLEVKGSVEGYAYTYQWYVDGTAIEGATNATYSAVFTVADSGKYTCEVSYAGITETSEEIEVKVNALVIDLSSIALENNLFEETGEDITVNVTGLDVFANYADYVTYEVTGNVAKAVGTYEVVITINYNDGVDQDSVKVENNNPLAWEIKAKPVVPPVPEYSYTYNYNEVDREYDGTVTTIEVTVTSTVEGDQFTATYQWYKDEKVLVGSTANTISVSEVADTGTYYCLVTVNGTALEKETIEVVIHPMTLDVTSITLKPGTSFEYTGEEITVELDYPAALDTYLDINPSLTESQMSATDAGTYYVDVIINVKEDLDEENFDINLDGLTLPYIGDGIDNIIRLTWEIKEGGVTPPPAGTKSEFTYSEGGITLTVTIKSGTPINENFELDAVAKNAADYTSEFGTVLVVYDILFMDGNQVATLPSDNTYEVTLTLDAATAAKSGLFVIYFPDDASAAQEKLDATVANGKITFTTTHFSVYGVAEPEQDPIIPGPGPSDEPTMEPTVEPSDQPSGDQPGTDKPVEPSEQPSWWVWVLLVLSGIIIALLLVLILRKREPVVVPVVAEPTAAEVSYIVVNENGVELVKLGEAQADDILSDVPTNEHTIGTVADDKVTIFKSARQLRTAIGKIKDYNGNLSILVHKEPYKVVEKIVVDRGAQAINEETVHVEVGQIAENNEKVIVKIFKNPKNVD